MKNYEDLSNKKFGKLFVIKRDKQPSHISNTSRSTYWLCKCDCGKEVTIVRYSLTNGNTKSCGCIKLILTADEAQKSSAKIIFDTKYSDGDLSFDEFYTLSKKNCFYCDAAPANCRNIHKHRKNSGRPVGEFAIENGDFIYNGLDRVDNNKLHNKNNVVPCCFSCNRAKSNLSNDEVKELLWRLFMINNKLQFL